MAIATEKLQGFHRRLFEWGQEEWTEEIGSGLGRLAQIESVEAEAFCAILRPLPASELRFLATALNKSRPMGPTGLVADVAGGLSLHEENRVSWFRDLARTRMVGRQLTGAAGAWTSDRASRTGLRRGLRNALDGIVGDYEEFGGANEWRYRLKMGRWQVLTHIDLSDRQQQLIHDQGVLLGDDCLLIQGISLMSWLGVMGSTRWNTLRPGREGAAVEHVKDQCDRFLKKLPALLEGLE